MTYLIFGEEYLELSARECRSPLELPQPSRVESGWVVSVGADTSQALTADTTHNVPPVFSWFAGGATEPREGSSLSVLPGVRRFPFRVG